MPTIDWPATWEPRQLTFGASTPKSIYIGHFTGAPQTIGHLADRLRCTIRLPKCPPDVGRQREAWLLHVASSGSWVRMGHLQRSVPAGTMRGSPTVYAAAAAGSRSVQIQTTPAATLAAGDPFGIGGRLLIVGPDGATADGSGRATVPLALPLLAAAAGGAAITWQAPTDTWALIADQPGVTWGRGNWQDELELVLQQVP